MPKPLNLRELSAIESLRCSADSFGDDAEIDNYQSQFIIACLENADLAKHAMAQHFAWSTDEKFPTPPSGFDDDDEDSPESADKKE